MSLGLTCTSLQAGPPDQGTLPRHTSCDPIRGCWHNPGMQVQEQIAARAAARAAKDFAAADGVRKQLEAVGVWLMDTPGGTTWRPGLPSSQGEAA
jgi:hypothetical protein